LTQNVEVTCDNCDDVFTIDKIKSKRVGIYQGNTVRFNYFNCSKCKKKYFVGIKEKEYNKLLAKLRHIQSKLRVYVDADDDRNIDEIDKLQVESVRIQGEIKARGDMLKMLFVLK